MIQYYGHTIESGDDESVIMAKSQINDDVMLTTDYWIPQEDNEEYYEDEEDVRKADLIDYHYILDSYLRVVGMELIIGI